MIKLSLFVIGSLVVATGFAAVLPKWITPCHKADSTTNECVKDNILNVLRAGKSGFPELNIPALDPILIENATSPESLGPVSLKQFYPNFYYVGASVAEITQLRANFVDKCQIKIKSYQPQIRTYGNYSAQGRLLAVQLNGFGEFDIISNDVSMLTTVNCDFYDKNGEQYFRIRNIECNSRSESGTFNYTNIVQDNVDFSQTINNILNDNYRDVFKEYSSVLIHGVERDFVEITNKMLDNIPAKYLFKD